MPLKPGKMTGKLVAIVEGCHSPPLFVVVTCALEASNTEEEFLKRLEYGLEKLTAEINVMEMQIQEINMEVKI